MNSKLVELESTPALQQPAWPDAHAVGEIRKELSALPALVRGDDVRILRAQLAKVAMGEAQVVQCGDCAEDPAECAHSYVTRKAGLLDMLAGAMKMNVGVPVLRVGRIAGQFAKPRSATCEQVGDTRVPVYRGSMVNSPEPDPKRRQPDPRRILSGYHAARDAMAALGWRETTGRLRIEPPVWTSHEALLLDYEIPMLRLDDAGEPLLTSTHWPWIGERTRRVDGAHVALLASVANPVACKVGPRMDVDELLELCARLDPHREPGRLTLIARMGADVVAERLPALVATVRAAGHPVAWLTDPMHGNTVTVLDGFKTRFVDTIVREVREFQRAVREAGGIAGGLHLETTPEDITECVANATEVDRVRDKYTTLCDPRLNAWQALSVVSAWGG